jgi:hypothetical protein
MKTLPIDQIKLWHEKTVDEIIKDFRRAFNVMQPLTEKTKEEKELCYGKKKI